ncbi:MAG: glycoside hydrolase family 43 protein [Prolixibacteraceae bacterium]
MKYLFFFLGIGLFIGCATNKEQTETSGNPLFDGQWYADPEVAVFGDEYWIFPTFSAEFDKQVFFDCFSSPDLVNWTKHENILDTAEVKWAHRAMWAPCAVENNGKYYFFFGANDIQRPVSKWWNPEIHSVDDVGGIGIAVADHPAGPYEDYLGEPLIGEVHNGAQPIDQFVFKDKDGQWYIIYGGWSKCNIAKLKDDFTGLIPFEDGEIFKDITPEGYVEGPVIFIKDGMYYFMWSEGNWTQDNYRVAYGRSELLLGPYERMGTVLESDSTIATGAGHHSVLNYPNSDDWYIFYHRRPIPNESPHHRVTCIDRMYFNADGSIQPIKMTFEGVEKRRLDK